MGLRGLLSNGIRRTLWCSAWAPRTRTFGAALPGELMGGAGHTIRTDPSSPLPRKQGANCLALRLTRLAAAQTFGKLAAQGAQAE